MKRREARDRRPCGWGAVLGVLLLSSGAACRGDELHVDASVVVQAATPKAPVVLPNADSATKYAKACGLGDPPDMKLPDLGTKAAPIRGTTNAADVGVKISNEWTLIQHFVNDSACVASSPDLHANLWHRTKGGREWYYLYRFEDSDPDKVQKNANGVLGFDATTICSFDSAHGMDNKAKPPVDLSNLYYAGELDFDPKMDDCSMCHLHGYNAPRPKTLAVAGGDTPDMKRPWLKVKWLDKWKAFAAAYGPVWNLGKATTDDKWTSGRGTALVTPPKECKTCHGDHWIPVLANQEGFYCDFVFAAAFDANGSMKKQGSKFRDNATCKKFIDDLGCGATRPMGATNLATTLCPPAFRSRNASLDTSPIVNDERLLIASATAVTPSAVHVVPLHNPAIVWDHSSSTSAGNPWVTSLQVWGSTIPDVETAPLSSVTTVADPDVLPAYLEVSGLTAGVEYHLQLRVTSDDGSYSFSPLVTVVMPPPPDAGPDAGPPDGGPDARPDGGGPDSGLPDSGTPDSGTPDSGMPDSGLPDAPPCWVDAGPDAGWDGGPCPDAGPDARPDAPPDAGPDAPPDAGPDAPPDAGPDAGPGDGCRDCHSPSIRQHSLGKGSVCAIFVSHAAPRTVPVRRSR